MRYLLYFQEKYTKRSIANFKKNVESRHGQAYVEKFRELNLFRLVVIATHRDDDPADEEEEGDEELPEDDLQKKDKKKKPDVS